MNRDNWDEEDKRRAERARATWGVNLERTRRLEESLNVEAAQLSTTDPVTWSLLPGILTIASLQPSHGRGIIHARRNNGIGSDTAWCGKKKAVLAGGHKDPNCILCAATLLKRHYAMFYQTNV